MSVASDIAATWWRPRVVMRKLLAMGPREDRALMVLLLACFLIFVAQWPLLSRQAFEDPSVPLRARIGGALMAWMFWMPVVCYGLAAATRLMAMAFGGRGTWYSARLALFWSLLAAAPAWLLRGMVAGFIGPGPALQLADAALLLAFLTFWGICLRVAETGSKARGQALS